MSDEVVSTLASQLTALEDAYTHGELVGDTVATVFFGDKLSLTASDAFGWSTATEWDNGQTGTTANYGHITTERTIQTYILSQGERKEPVNFHIRLKYIEPRIIRNGTIYQDTTHIVVSTGDMVTLQPYVPTAVGPVSYQWNDGSTKSTLSLDAVASSGIYTVTISWANHTETITYEVFIKDTDTSHALPDGNYLIRHAATNTFMTGNGLQQPITFAKGSTEEPSEGQVWFVSGSANRYSLQSLPDSLAFNTTGKTGSAVLRSFYLEKALDLDRYAIRSGSGSNSKYWTATDGGAIQPLSSSSPTDFPFEFIPTPDINGVRLPMTGGANDSVIYDLQGRRLTSVPKRGVYLINGQKHVR